MEKNLVEADVRLAKFCAETKGTISSPTEHTWKRGDKRAKLDHGSSWNFHLASPRAVLRDNVVYWKTKRKIKDDLQCI
jgi:hypothetical protein